MKEGEGDEEAKERQQTADRGEGDEDDFSCLNAQGNRLIFGWRRERNLRCRNEDELLLRSMKAEVADAMEARPIAVRGAAENW